MPEPKKTATGQTQGEQVKPQEAQGQQQGQESETPTPPAFDAWLQEQPEEVKGLLDGHVKGLKNALQSERDEKRKLQNDLEKVAKGFLEEGSEARKAVEKISGDLDNANRRVEFYEDAIPQGCSNPKLAWLAAVEIAAIDGRGKVNWDALKEQFPELFKRTAPPPAHAGAGTGQPAQGFDMNRAIRGATGRQA
jgi:hypothetical protein